MLKRQRKLCILLSVLMAAAMIAGCGSTPAPAATTAAVTTAAAATEAAAAEAETTAEATTAPAAETTAAPETTTAAAETTTTAAQASDPETSPQQGGVKLTMIESLGNTVRTASLRGILDEFEAGTGHQVELISPPLDGADQKIAQMLMAKSELDVLEVRGWTLGQFMRNGWLKPITDYVADWPDLDTIAEVMKYGMYNEGEVWGIPIGSYQRMIYYRSDWLEEAGLTIPTGEDWTFDKLYELSLQLTDPENGHYGWALRGSGNAYQQFIQMVTFAAIGSEGFLEFETMFTKDKLSIYRSEAAKKGFEFQKKFYENCSPKDSIAWGFTDQVDAFSSGVTAFLMQDSDCVGIFNDRMDPGSWATVPMPVDAETKQGMLGVGSDLWGMTSYTEYPEASWELLAFLGSPVMSTRFCKDYGVIPPHTTAADIDSTFKTGPYSAYVYMFGRPEMYFALPTAGIELLYSMDGSEFGQISDVDIQNVLMGVADMDEMLAKWADLWEKARADANLD